MEHNRQRIVFRTRVDWWLGVVTALYVVVSIAAPAMHVMRVMDGREAFSLAGLLVPLLILGLVTAVSIPCYYALQDDMLLIRSGFLLTRIPVHAIRLVCATRSLLSAPAWSLDRLEIRYGQGMHRVIISPVNKPEFLRALVRRAPQLEWRGADLVISEDWASMMPEHKSS